MGWGCPSAKSLLTSCHPSLGLQNLHLLTLKQKYELRVDLEDFENNTAYAKYIDFSISPNAVSAEEDGYTLYVAGFEDGGAGTPLGFFRGTGGVEGGVNNIGLALLHWFLKAPPSTLLGVKEP